MPQQGVSVSKLPLLCRLGLHTDVVFHQEGDRYCTRFEPSIWDWAICHKCDQRLAPTKKVLRCKRELDAEVARIKKEIELYGHPLLTGISL